MRMPVRPFDGSRLIRMMRFSKSPFSCVEVARLPRHRMMNTNLPIPLSFVV